MNLGTLIGAETRSGVWQEPLVAACTLPEFRLDGPQLTVTPSFEQLGNLGVLFHHQPEIPVADVEEVEGEAHAQTG